MADSERSYNERPAARPLGGDINHSVDSSNTLDQASAKPVTKPFWRSWLFWAVVILISFFIVNGLNSTDSSSNRQASAVVACQNLVKQNLKSPSSAKFPYVPKVTGSSIVGEVDAQNSFGANIRSSFKCTIVGDRVRLDKLG